MSAKHLLLLLLPIAALTACEAEPELSELSDAELDELMLENTAPMVLGLIERCKNMNDDDGDGQIDENPCFGGVADGRGIVGDLLEGTNIHGDPLSREAMAAYSGSATMSFRPRTSSAPARITVDNVVGRTTNRTVVDLSRLEPVNVAYAMEYGARTPSLVIDTADGHTYLAPAPIENGAFSDR